MFGFKLRTKLLLLSLVPLVLVVATIMLVVRSEMQAMGDVEIDRIRTDMMQAKRDELRNYVQQAMSAVKPLQQGSGDLAARQAQAVTLLNAMEYGSDGYFFGYNAEGVTIVHGASAAQIGKTTLDVKDANGFAFIREMIKAARDGSGYVEYAWAKPGAREASPKLSYTATMPGSWNWIIGTGFYIDDIEAAVAEAEVEIGEAINATLSLIGLSALVLLGGVAALSSWLAQRMVRPLQQTAAALKDISQGEGNLTHRLPVETRDEVGDVASGFNEFVEKIQQLVQEVKQGIESLGQSTESMRSVVMLTHQDAHVQKEETSQAAAAVHEMAAAVQQVAGSAAQAAEAAREADNESLNGQGVVEQTIDSINRLAENVNRSAGVIGSLDADVNQIGSVANVIRDIAEQTNLLALNAAIEAARAGEQGRGFSVVADEVRTLATRTQQSTDEIQRMIEGLQSGAQQAVREMETSQTQSSETIDRADDARGSLQQITHSVSTITEMNTQIASAAEEQTAVADEISKSVQQIADIADKATRNAEELSGTASNMTELERHLSNLVSRFKT
ncbi:methyl-accepting chemotaxis protein [Marinobacterium stanieri]|uniref:Methyl-accepting chemotaxis sensory transducer with Cache sensor n=1 Tax=Marinobacterium stanieri TaxID=49186 RepID=A0A1N6SE98_9GAMM|nr:methyl-accepting chemotaxis protein [Marinobacterium stanieri]SIQ39380.1 methyl-accepting chemotaxis sensory transducer with Cache sensor [Marinobacterium stanieri]